MNKSPPFLIGHGYDIHRLEKSTGKRLILGGVVVSEQIQPIAHSDGDVILHALVDAMLGAMGCGDIGQLFGDSDPKHKDADSSTFVKEVFGRIRAMKYHVVNVDVSLILERPKILPFKAKMIETIHALLPGASHVNVKAGTNEECDAVGRGEAVVAHAVVLLAADA